MVSKWPESCHRFTQGTGEFEIEAWLKNNKKRFIKQLNVCDYHTTWMIKIKDNKNELILFDEIAREIANPLRDVLFLNIDDVTCADCDVGDFAKEKRSRRCTSRKRKLPPPTSSNKKKRKVATQSVHLGDSTNSDEYDEDKDNKSKRKPKTDVFLWGELIDTLTAKYKSALTQKGIVEYAKLLMESKDYDADTIPPQILAEHKIKEKPTYSTTTTHQQSQNPQIPNSQPVSPFMMPYVNPHFTVQNAQFMSQTQPAAMMHHPFNPYAQFYPGFGHLFSGFTTPKSSPASIIDKENKKQDKQEKKNKVSEEENEDAGSLTLEDIAKDIDDADSLNLVAPLPIETDPREGNGSE